MSDEVKLEPQGEGCPVCAARERGWLVEGTHMTDSFGIHWFDARLGFQADVDRALRFARKEDAETFMREYRVKGTATEHQWG